MAGLTPGTYYYNGGKVNIPANFNPTSAAAKKMVQDLYTQQVKIKERATVAPGGALYKAAAAKNNPTNNAGYKPPAPKAPAKAPAKAAPKAPTPAPRTTSTGRSSGGGSSGGGGGVYDGGGGGGGGFAAAPVMQDITIPDATEDTDYKRTVSDLARALTDFGAQQGLSRKQYDFGFGEAKRKMGWKADPADATKGAFDRGLPGAYGDAVYANENDFAGRGLTWSGLFGKASGDINQEFADRGKNLDVARQDNIDTQNLAKNTFVSNQDATKEVAKQNAISKIMAQLGVSAGEVPVGTGSRVIQRQAIL